MNKDTVIQVEGLAKRYLLGRKRPRTLVERLARMGGDLMRGLKTSDVSAENEFWALRDLSFSVQRGEIVGIIGRNGAGKSTLLKILSRITEPTLGRACIRGRVASLLEVGTGFHPELSGRDNVFLNGTILGLRRREILERFDEIVAFSGLEQFIDTPVKYYSSGMYVRLAFAVAAHLEPEILIIDEVLAVGDASFQKKCIGKIRDIAASEQRTVLFISHDMSAVSALTKRCLLMEQGRLVREGPTQEVVSAYFAGMRRSGEHLEQARPGRPGVHSVKIECSKPGCTQVYGEAFSVTVRLSHPVAVQGACVNIHLVNQYGQAVAHFWHYPADRVFAAEPGETTLVCRVPRVRLNVGDYTVRVYFSEPPGGEVFNFIDGVCPFQVIRDDATQLWGWRPDVCTYFEDAEWSQRSENAGS